MRTLKILAYPILAFMLSACCEPQLTASYLLTDNEKLLITPVGYDDLVYLVGTGGRFIATTQPKEDVISTESEKGEKCSYTEYERMWTFYNFTRQGFAIQVEINKSPVKSFRLSKFNTDTGSGSEAWFELTCGGNNSIPFEEQTTDISTSGFNFKDVFVFTNCSKTQDITRIIYSAKNGIELIEFKNGDYYKLNVLK